MFYNRNFGLRMDLVTRLIHLNYFHKVLIRDFCPQQELRIIIRTLRDSDVYVATLRERPKHVLRV
jgi:hypothetical protein